MYVYKSPPLPRKPLEWISEIPHSLYVIFHVSSLLFSSHPISFSLSSSSFCNVLGHYSISFHCILIELDGSLKTFCVFQIVWINSPLLTMHPTVSDTCLSAPQSLGSIVGYSLFQRFYLTQQNQGGAGRSCPLSFGMRGWWTRIIYLKTLNQCLVCILRGTLHRSSSSMQPQATQSTPGIHLPHFRLLPQGPSSSVGN